MPEQEHPSPILSRRELLKGAAALGVAGSLGLRAHDAAANAPEKLVGEATLRSVADREGFQIGALNSSDGENFNFSMIDAGPMHWNTLCPTSGDPKDYNFSSLDSDLVQAKENKMLVQAHHLVWGYNGSDAPRVPQWALEELDQNGGDPMPIIEKHIETVTSHNMEKFPNVVRAYTAVNEPLNPAGEYGDYEYSNGFPTFTNVFNNSSADKYGDPRAYIIKTFQIAADALKPKGKQTHKTVLLTNEHSAEQPNTPKGQGYLDLANYMKEQGLSMDDIGFGFQMHLFPGTDTWGNGLTLANSDEIQQFAQNFKDHASQFPAAPYITEMDIDPSGWSAMGYSAEDMRSLAGETYGAITQALIDAGGKSLMSFSDTMIMSRFKSQPDSAYNQLIHAIGSLKK
jgi:GH35 family endo-1,4-beta-xylanase